MKQYEKIHVIGDSHALIFYGMHERINAFNIGPNLMHHFGKERVDSAFDEFFIPWKRVSRDGLWIFAFGEIDVRRHINKQIVEKGRDEDEVIKTLVDNYFYLNCDIHPDVGFMSVVPPIAYYRDEEYYSNAFKNDPKFYVIGSDEDRSRYTKKINNLLKSRCEEKNVLYLDVYSLTADDQGFLIKEYSDGTVHAYKCHHLTVPLIFNLLSQN